MRGAPFLATVVVAGLAAALYVPTLRYAFAFDDFPAIAENAALLSATPIADIWASFSTRILAFLSFYANFRLTGTAPAGFRAVNIVIHVVNALLVLRLALDVLARDTGGREEDRDARRTIAAWTACLLFLLHPMQTQAVTYIHQRLASMVAMFYLGALVAYAASRRASIAGAVGRSRGLLCVSTLSAVLAMTTKENAASLPAAILLLEMLVVGSRPWRERLRSLAAPMATIAVVPLLMALGRGSFVAGVQYHSESGLTSYQYFCTQLHVIWMYVGLWVLPIGQNLDHDVTLRTTLWETSTLLGGLALLLCGVLGLVQMRRRPVVAFAILFMFVAFSVESSIVPIRDLSFEHRAYLSSFGFFLLVGLAVARLVAVARLSARPVAALAAVTLLVLPLMEVSRRRNTVWESDLTLWSDSIAKAPLRMRAHANLAAALASRGELDRAIEHFQIAAARDPKAQLALGGLASAALTAGKSDLAWVTAEQLVRVAPEDWNASRQLVAAAADLGLYDAAEAELERGLAAWSKVATHASDYAHLAARRGDFDAALQRLEATVEADPNSWPAQLARGWVLVAAGRVDEGIRSVKEWSAGREVAVVREAERETVLMALGRHDRREAGMDAARGYLKRRLTDMVVRMRLAGAYIAEGRMQDAGKTLAWAKLNPRAVDEALAGTGTLRRQGRLLEAIELLVALGDVCATRILPCAAKARIEADLVALAAAVTPSPAAEVEALVARWRAAGEPEAAPATGH